MTTLIDHALPRGIETFSSRTWRERRGFDRGVRRAGLLGLGRWHHACVISKIYKFEPGGVSLEKDESGMKKLTVIGLLVVIAAVCVLLHRQHVESGARFDSEFRQQLAGVWWRQEAGMRSTNTVAADGSFVDLSWFSHPDRTNTYQRTGTWLVKNGQLIETIQSSSNSTEVTPHTGAARIIRSGASEFAVRWANSVETVWQKIQ